MLYNELHTFSKWEALDNHREDLVYAYDLSVNKFLSEYQTCLNITAKFCILDASFSHFAYDKNSKSPEQLVSEDFLHYFDNAIKRAYQKTNTKDDFYRLLSNYVRRHIENKRNILMSDAVIGKYLQSRKIEFDEFGIDLKEC